MKNSKELAAFIDHTLLKPDSTASMVEKLCLEAKTHEFCSVCILPSFVSLASTCLKDSNVKVCTVIGFPLGASESAIKAIETGVAIDQGADEVDMVLNIGLLKSAELEKAGADIGAVVGAARGKIVKVILETCLLSESEKIQACELCVEAGADFVKTSTGFSSAGATVEDVQLMRNSVGNELGVKASGGVRDYETACAMIEAGASRLGTSSGLSIIGADKDSAAENY
jgi:deoxyribose-phosphate aldolase